jgi:indole-3-glycerol phosphate synthase
MNNIPDILQQIISTKHIELVSLKRHVSLEQIKLEAYDYIKQANNACRNFSYSINNHINNGQSAVIAEIKKASPSKGILCNDFDIAKIARQYEESGACCLSVLTDEHYFMGKAEYINMAKQASKLPILRKDFIVDEYQIYESRLMGADAILLIASVLSAEQMLHFEQIATSLGLDVLPEVHHESELHKALALKTPLIGINNRNLSTFKVDLNNTIALLKYINDNKIIVTESGILNKQDVEFMHANNIYAFLVGEVFMRSDNAGSKLSDMFML